MTLYCLDTNVISAVMAGDQAVIKRWVGATREGHGVSLSAVTYYEVKRGLDLPRLARKYAAFQGIVAQSQILIPNLPTYDVAAQIYQDLKVSGTPIEDADILIAATALAFGATLVTRNIKHMQRITGLSLESWHAEKEQQ
ncbi:MULTISPECIES: PIN domain-containing protein [Deinococcus]|uniref:Ribonuclease VapC n=1 Tax=Deinococcus rufus TaxID=2136097 RepID=A0ABV7Z2U5_9DEIO|nr:PIN domain-containing protein [Deinococcus sp. AB2017081]WQE95791.1 PIN domain-containing protein [Deinococcus sp. AB2017081]